MDLKLGFCTLFLVLLVAYEAEGRKIAKGNIQDKRLNFPLAQVHLSSNGDLQNKDDTKTENARVSNIFWYGDMQNKDDAKRENAPISNIFWYGDMQNKYDAKSKNAPAGNIFWYGDSQNKDDAKMENAPAGNIFWYGDLQNKDDAKTKNAPAGNIFWYGDLQNKDDAKIENTPTGNIFWYGDLQNKDDAKTENAPAGNIFWYGDLQNKDDAKTENARAGNILLYGDLQNKDDAKTKNAPAGNIFWYGDLQNKTKNAPVSNIFWYGDLQNKTENAPVSNIFWYGDLQNKTENAPAGNLLWYGNLQNKDDAKTENAHIHSSDHVDPSVRVFFLLDDLKVSKEISVSFPRRASNFLPKGEADSIPFSLKELPNLLQRFAISKNSPQAKTMEETLRVCEFPPIKGETKYCATSREVMLDFVQGIMGEKTQIKALATTPSSNSTPLLQKYTILDAPQEVETPKMVACHPMSYPYAIFYCHNTVSKSKVFKVSLRGENGDRVEAIAVCHLDTSDWSPSHISFRFLGVSPGTSPVCHFFPSGHLVWVSKIANAQVI